MDIAFHIGYLIQPRKKTKTVKHSLYATAGVTRPEFW